MKESLDKREFFYEFVIIFFDLFRDEKDIYERNLKLLSQIFLIEIEKLDGELFLIERILNKPKQLELFISFLSILVQTLKEENDIETITYSLEKISDIIEAQITKDINKNKKKKEKYILKKNEFETIFKFCSLKKQKDKAIESMELFNAQLHFLKKFLSLINFYFSYDEIYEDISCRNLLYNKIISSLSKVLMLIINECDNSYIHSLIDLVKQLIYIIKKNTTNFFVDFEIIHKYLNHSLYKLSKIEKNEINILYFKLVYSISILIITQLKIIYCIPTSILNLHNEIIQEIGETNHKYKEYFKNIDIEAYKKYSSKNLDDLNDIFYKNLIKEFPKNKSNENKKLILKNNDFKYLINIIHNKLYGKNSPLIIYYKSQENKNNSKRKEENIDIDENLNIDDFEELIINEEKNDYDSLIISINESNNFIDMSIGVKRSMFLETKEDNEENSYISYHSTQNINIPKNNDDDEEEEEEDEKDENESEVNLINDKFDLNSSSRDEKSLNNFKI